MDRLQALLIQKTRLQGRGAIFRGVGYLRASAPLIVEINGVVTGSVGMPVVVQVVQEVVKPFSRGYGGDSSPAGAEWAHTLVRYFVGLDRLVRTSSGRRNTGRFARE